MNAPIPVAESFHFCPRCGTPREDTSSDDGAAEADKANPGRSCNPFRCHACSFVFYFGPVGAVGAIIADKQDRILLIRRAKDPGKGQYGLPGGFVDPGERAEEALRREVCEELGLTVLSMKQLTTFPNTYCYKGVILQVLDVFYVCTVDPNEVVRADDVEVTSWEWAKCNEKTLSQMAFDSNRKALKVFLEGDVNTESKNNARC